MTTATRAEQGESERRVVVSGDGVQVRKWVSDEDAPVPVVKYEIASARDDDVTIRMTDAIPSHLDPDDVGFHDDYLGDRWMRPSPRAVRFESTLHAGEELTTVYGIRQESIDDPDAFLERPTLAVAAATREDGDDDPAAEARLDRALDEAAAASEGDAPDSQADRPAVEDGTDGETEIEADGPAIEPGDETLSLDDPTVGDGDESAATADSADASAPAAADAANDAGAGDADGSLPGTDGRSGMPVWDEDGGHEADGPEADRSEAHGSEDGGAADDGAGNAEAAAAAATPGASAAVDGDDGAVATALVEELRSGEVDEATQEALAQELNLQLSASSSQFVEHLQSRMKEKRGQLEGDIERLEDSIAELYGLKADSSVVSTVREEAADQSAVEAVEAALEDVHESKADLEAVAAVEDAVAELEDAAATESALAETREELTARLEELDDETASEAGVEELARGVRDLDDETPTLSAFEDLHAEHETLSDEAARTSDLESLREDLEATEASLVDEVDAERRERKDERSTLTGRLDDLESASATKERVASVEADLTERYVTEDDITEALERRLETTLRARVALGGGGLLAGAGLALLATGTTAGVALVLAGVAALGYWWWLNDQELDATTD